MKSRLLITFILALLPLSAGAQTAQVIADVSLQDCSYTQTGGQFGVSCSITNRFKDQGDIRYAVELLKRTASSTVEVADMKVYDPVLSLRAEETVSIKADYTAPAFFSGKYELWIVSKTSDGLGLSSQQLGTVSLKATDVSYLEVKDCVLYVAGEPAAKTYVLGQGVDINPDEILEGSCTVTAHTTQDMSVTPSFATHAQSVFGTVVPEASGAQPAISFKRGETKTYAFTVPKSVTPQAYDALLTFRAGDAALSSPIDIRYIVRGPSAVIQSVLLEKSRYERGDTAYVSLLWSGSTILGGGVRKGPLADTVAKVALSLSDENGTACADDTTFTIAANAPERHQLTAYPLKVNRFCLSPRVTVKFLDASGATLTEKTIAFEGERLAGDAFRVFLSAYGWYIVAGLIVILALVGGILKNRKSIAV